MEKRICLYLLFFLVLFSFSCEKEDIDPVFEEKDNPKEKEIPEGSRKVSIKIDSKYDFKNTIAYGLSDSVSMSALDKSLAVRKEHGDFVMFIDKDSEHILAVAFVDSSSTELNLSATTVAAALQDLIPSYLSLPKDIREEFNSDATTIQEYKDFINIVDEILVKKEKIYSVEEKFIVQLDKINQYILNKYSSNNNNEGGRLEFDQGIKHWLVKEKSPEIANPVYSHVDAKFIPVLRDKGLPDVIVEVKPNRPIYKLQENIPDGSVFTSTITPVSLKDGYYQIQLSQNPGPALEKNIGEAVSTFVNLAVGLYLDKEFGEAPERLACMQDIILPIKAGIVSSLPSLTKDWKSASSELVSIGGDVLIDNLTSSSCMKAALSAVSLNKLALMVADKLNVYKLQIKIAKGLLDTYEICLWVAGIVVPIKHTALMQVHYGKVIPGTIGFMESEEGELLESYEPGKNIIPGVKAQILSSYDEIVFAHFDFNVDWVVEEGHGTISEKTGLDHLGRSPTSWTLPQVKGDYKATASIINRSGNLLGSPVKFETKVEEGDSTFTDPRDGNVYKTVKIGTQTWFAENLRYSGDIPHVPSAEAWKAIYNKGNPTGQPAWANYKNDSNNDKIYGKLYNWYAVNTGTLCPSGWHIPTDAEWTTLTNHLGGPFVAGGKMKSVTGWSAPNTAATNESGFTGLPGGIRHFTGQFTNLGSYGFWWSSSPTDTNDAWNRFLLSSSGSFNRGDYDRPDGLSCRCLRD